jgi:hypothetical protein
MTRTAAAAITGAMDHPARREFEAARLAARERRLRLVRQILSAHAPAQQPVRRAGERTDRFARRTSERDASHTPPE